MPLTLLPAPQIQKAIYTSESRMFPERTLLLVTTFNVNRIHYLELQQSHNLYDFTHSEPG